MDQYRLYLFQPAGDTPDYVVISDQPWDDVIAEYAPDQLSKVVDVDGDCLMFPCDRPLEHS